jgi:alginate O-acetyltransferase complex protein AlgI
MSVALCFFIAWAMPNTQEILGQIGSGNVRWPSLLPRLLWRPTMVWSVALTLLFGISILMLDANAAFLYFQF